MITSIRPSLPCTILDLIISIIDAKMIEDIIIIRFDIYKHNPWRAPGSAPVLDACGLAGGTPWGGDVAECGERKLF